MIFLDRKEAGRELATELRQFAEREDVLVLGLPRGGVVVAYEVALALHVPLDVFLVRKLGFPHHPEAAMGAIASGGIRLLDDPTIQSVGISADEIESIAEREKLILEEREKTYRQGRTPPAVQDRIVILVDDGLATGFTMRAAIAGLRQLHPQKIIVAVPVGTTEISHELQQEADEVICLEMPEPFYAVGAWYRDFSEVSDAEVRQLLSQAEEYFVSDVSKIVI